MNYKPEWMKDADPEEPEVPEEPEKGYESLMKKVVLTIHPSSIVDLSMVDPSNIVIAGREGKEKTFSDSVTARVTGVTEDQGMLLFEMAVPIEDSISEDVLFEYISGIAEQDQGDDVDFENVWIHSYKVLGFRDGLMGIEIEYQLE